VIEPGLAAGTSMRPFMARVRAAAPASAPLYFFGGHPDYEVIFYADRRLPTLRRRDLDRIAETEPAARVLLFEKRWRTLDPTVRERFTLLDRSVEVRDHDRGRLLLVGFTAMPARMATPAPGSSDVEAVLDVRFAGSSTLHGFAGTAPSVRVPLAATADGTWSASVEVPVATLDTGNGRRDAQMREMLHADTHPVLRGVVEGIRPETVERTGRLPVALTIAGVTRQVGARVRRWTAAPGQVSFDAGFDVSLAAHGLEAPRTLLVVRVADVVHVDVQVTVRHH
jgi:polyisoprenoid-binding protein YceI